LTEEQPNKESDEIKTPFGDIKKEFEVLENTIKMQKGELDTQLKLLKLLTNAVNRIQTDLNLECERYGGQSTRDMAIEAFNQSTVSANWEGLSKHPVIKAIHEALENRASVEGQRADDILRKFENQPTYDEFMEHLKGSWFFKELKEEMVKFERIQDSTISTVRNDRAHANSHDLKQRDKIADIQTAMDALEFLHSEYNEMVSGAFIFLMGAFAEMDKGQVEEGLRFMLKKPKEEPKDNGKVQDTLQKSEG